MMPMTYSRFRTSVGRKSRMPRAGLLLAIEKINRDEVDEKDGQKKSLSSSASLQRIDSTRIVLLTEKRVSEVEDLRVVAGVLDTAARVGDVIELVAECDRFFVCESVFDPGTCL